MGQDRQLNKICKGCELTKPRLEFREYKSGEKAGQLASGFCIKCERVSNNTRQAKARGNPDYQARGFYRMTPEMKVSQKSRYRKGKTARVKDFVSTFLIGQKCLTCPESRLVCLQFDHRDPKTKEFEIAKALKGSISLERIKAEIAKCDIVCANCHLVRTAAQFGNWRLGL